ncbi:MAG: hypothetical protein Q4C67_11440 [Deinococcus sp.]|nr:hypothetical protein [Deinococcus sp.]
MKRLSFALCMSGLLVGCGGTPAPAPTPELQRVPDVEVQLPELRDFPSQTRRLQAQASTLPAWTGEKLYEGYNQFGPELEVTNAGDMMSVNLRASTGGVYPTFTRVWNSVGGDYQELTANGSGSGVGLAIDPRFYPGGADRKNAWLVRSSGGGDASSYTLNVYNRSFRESPLVVTGPTSQSLTIYNGINRDPDGSLDME